LDQRYNTLRFWCATIAFFIVVACIFAAVSSWRSLQFRLDQTAAAALYGAEHLFTRSARDLEKLDGLRLSDCNEKTVNALKDAVYNAVLPVREMGLIRNSRLYCTNFGPFDIALNEPNLRLTAGTHLTIGVNSVMPGNRSLFLYRILTQGSGVNAVINAPILGEFERGFEFSSFGTQRLVFTDPKLSSDGSTNAELIYEIGLSQAGLKDAFWHARAESKLFPIAAEVAVTPSAFWSEWRDALPQMLLSFALLGALVGLITSMWIKRGGPSRMRYQRALTRKELVVHYQPICNAKTGDIVGVEALLRWQHPTAGLLRAAEFSPLFDDPAMLLPLSKYVLATVAHDLKTIDEYGSVWCSINVPTQIFEGPNLINTLTALVKNMAVRRLRLEVTERSPMTAAAEQSIREIRALGIGVGMDDIGTGHSNLDQLQRMVYDFIKIDGMLVRGIVSSETISPVVLSLIALGKQIKTEIIAEGVETQAQSDALVKAGVDEMQGYLYGRAEPIEDIAARLKLQTNAHRRAANSTAQVISRAGQTTPTN
jgi:sensor c-di-GMP phosphodiesterase-like protein